ncbi:MAG: sirohydrochlorin cobaltochelatase [Desulfuromusa sp.]|nr:sirohydrochlorin cobaltochelatase [Desulfuromusa sp.]
MTDPDSCCFESLLEKEGITVPPYLHGIGENDRVAEIYVQHAADMVEDVGTELK